LNNLQPIPNDKASTKPIGFAVATALKEVIITEQQMYLNRSCHPEFFSVAFRKKIINTLYEALYKKHGMQPLQNGCEG
jgi:hypothetical protein